MVPAGELPTDVVRVGVEWRGLDATGERLPCAVHPQRATPIAKDENAHRIGIMP